MISHIFPVGPHEATIDDLEANMGLLIRVIWPAMFKSGPKLDIYNAFRQEHLRCKNARNHFQILIVCIAISLKNKPFILVNISLCPENFSKYLFNYI